MKLLLGAFVMSVALFACNPTSTKTGDKEKMKINFSVIPEDYERNLYYVDWDDTLGLSAGYLPNKFYKRPWEVHCYVTNNSDDTLGYYQGLSSPQSFVYFTTTDTIVILNFQRGLNLPPEEFEQDTTGLTAFLRSNMTPVKYEPIQVRIDTDLRKEFEIELKEK